MTLKDKRIIVLGGTSGIGLAVAEAAATDGAQVLVAGPGPLSEPESAAVEVEGLRSHPLSGRDDFRVGLALVDLYDHHLGDPGRAMAELRRLIDRYPTASGARRLRAALSALKSQRFDGTQPSA